VTKRKAIEAAWKCDCDERGCTGKYIPETAAERGYVAGFTDGMREAARWVKSEGIDRSDGTFVMLIQLAKEICTEANRLAKKARNHAK